MKQESWPLKSEPRIKVTLDNIFGPGAEAGAEERYNKKMNIKPEELSPVPDHSQEDRLQQELHDKVDAENEPCELCGGTGIVQFGEYDDIKTKKCICRRQDDMDDDS